MATNIRPAPIVFTLNNTGAYHERSALIFMTFKIMLLLEGTSTKNYIAYLGYFKEAEVLLLLERIINRRNKEVTMNEKHFIIYNAVFSYIKKILLNPESEDAILLENAQVNRPNSKITKVKDLVIDFIIVGEQLFQSKCKNNHSLTVAFSKISSH